MPPHLSAAVRELNEVFWPQDWEESPYLARLGALRAIEPVAASWRSRVDLAPILTLAAAGTEHFQPALHAVLRSVLDNDQIFTFPPTVLATALAQACLSLSTSTSKLEVNLSSRSGAGQLRLPALTLRRRVRGHRKPEPLTRPRICASRKTAATYSICCEAFSVPLRTLAGPRCPSGTPVATSLLPPSGQCHTRRPHSTDDHKHHASATGRYQAGRRSEHRSRPLDRAIPCT
ncbi:hypothetical protein GCM10010403_51580 [Glycomyces rutgersensis]|uniref:Uncharacterized protein n=1 Tax=Glycomyces rutgersensis TaxID=58115 RepID=A0ABP5TEZ1_9ACTN